MTRVLLDTQAFYTIATDGLDALPRRARDVLEGSDTEGILSSASVMEIAIKYAIGKMQMDERYTRQGIRDLRLTILPFDSRHAYSLFSLPLHHRDPFDRMILDPGDRNCRETAHCKR